jgi:hypothetical protein
MVLKSKPVDDTDFLGTIEMFSTEKVDTVVTSPVMAPTSNPNPPMDLDEKLFRMFEAAERQRKADKEDSDRKQEELQRQMAELKAEKEEAKKAAEATLKTVKEKFVVGAASGAVIGSLATAFAWNRETDKLCLGATVGALVCASIAVLTSDAEKIHQNQRANEVQMARLVNTQFEQQQP